MIEINFLNERKIIAHTLVAIFIVGLLVIGA